MVRTSKWAAGVTYHNDENLTHQDGGRYVDVALTDNKTTESGYDIWLCTVTHEATTANSPSAPGGSGYWQEVNSMAPIYTSLIMAKNAKIDFMQGNELLIHKADGTVTAGLSGSSEGDKVRFWAGSDDPDTAPFKVLENGDARVRGDITATTYHIGNLTINNDGSLMHENGTYSISADGRLTTSNATISRGTIEVLSDDGNYRVRIDMQNGMPRISLDAKENGGTEFTQQAAFEYVENQSPWLSSYNARIFMHSTIFDKFSTGKRYHVYDTVFTPFALSMTTDSYADPTMVGARDVRETTIIPGRIILSKVIDGTTSEVTYAP